MRFFQIQTYFFVLALMLAGCQARQAASQGQDAAAQVRLITVDPGHFHAALVQKEMYPGVSRRVSVYAPLGPDLAEHLKRVARFNLRPDNPTSWEMEVHCSQDFFPRMLKERPGNVVVLSGRNRRKIDWIVASVKAGLNVLADKPWVLASADLPKLDTALQIAEQKGLLGYDIMTERYEITSVLQRELVHDTGIFGGILDGSPQEPGVYMESVHHIMKTVAGVPSLRPLPFFHIEEQGEGLSDVGTHLVDLVQWTLYSGQALDYRADVSVLDGERWPTVLSRADFQRVTGEAGFPETLSRYVRNNRLEYFCNNRVLYKLRNVHVKLDVLWRYEAPPGTGDTHFAVYRGAKSRIEVRQGKREKFRPELYVVPSAPELRNQVRQALAVRIEALQKQYPGVGLEDLGAEMLVTVPDRYRVGHEAHFAEVALQFLEYLGKPESLPAWERPHMLAKYYVTTRGVEAGRTRPVATGTLKSRGSLSPSP